jgi:hypothetical protein
MKRFFQYASLLLAAVMLISCEGTTGSTDAGKTLKLTSDKNLIQTFGGDYATLTVTLDGQKIVEDVLFFDENNELIDIADFKFSATEVGEYSIWANYGTYTSETITIRAIDIQIPSTPADPKPASTDFKTRALITEFTTVGCSACPSMKETLHSIESDATVADKAVFTECHSGLVNRVADPCYLHNNAFEEFCVIGGFPTVKLDLAGTYNNGNRHDLRGDISEVAAAKEAFAPGIAVNSVLKDGNVVAKVTVKAKVVSSYRVGAFIVEDGIVAEQTGVHDYVHNNVVRAVLTSEKGDKLNDNLPLTVGVEAKASKTFTLSPEWKKENLRVIVAASTSTDGGYTFVVNNVAECKLGESVDYQYAE